MPACGHCNCSGRPAISHPWMKRPPWGPAPALPLTVPLLCSPDLPAFPQIHSTFRLPCRLPDLPLPYPTYSHLCRKTTRGTGRRRAEEPPGQKTLAGLWTSNGTPCRPLVCVCVCLGLGPFFPLLWQIR